MMHLGRPSGRAHFGRAAILALILAACASSGKENKKELKEPKIGMTKAQAIAEYGKTKNTSVSSRGEIWTYHLNPGGAWVPFNFGYRPKVLVLTFDKSGKVTDYTWSR